MKTFLAATATTSNEGVSLNSNIKKISVNPVKASSTPLEIDGYIKFKVEEALSLERQKWDREKKELTER